MSFSKISTLGFRKGFHRIDDTFLQNNEIVMKGIEKEQDNEEESSSSLYIFAFIEFSKLIRNRYNKKYLDS